MAYKIDNKKIAKNTLALYIRIGFTMVISFFTARVTLQQLGVDDYGLNNLVSSIVSMLTFLNGSMGTAVQRFYSIEIGKNNESGLARVFGVGLSLHALVAAISFVTAEIFAIFFLHRMNIPTDRMMAAQIVFQISILSLVLNIINVPYAALLRAREMFSKMAMIEIIQSILRLGVLYLLVTVNYDKLIVLAALNLGVTLYYLGSLTILARRYEETHTFFVWDKELIKRMLSFISMLIITVLAQLAKTQGIVFLINLFFSLAINAAYAIAVQVSNIVNNFIASFKQSVVPQMMASYGSGDLPAMHKLINQGSKITFLLMVLLSMPVIFESELLLSLWLGTPPEHSAHLVALVLIYINIQSFTYFQYQGVHATGNITKQQVYVSCMYAINIALIWLCFKWGFSFEWALYVNMLVSAAQCVINLIFARKTYDYSIQKYCSSILLPSLLLVVILVAILGTVTTAIQNKIAETVLVFMLDITLVPILGYFLLLDKEEKQKVIGIVKSRLHL